MIRRIIKEYSNPDENRNFSYNVEPDKKMKAKANLIDEKLYKKVKNSNVYKLKFQAKDYELDLDAQTCNCRTYIDLKLCGHLLKANRHFDNVREFDNKQKRGRLSNLKHCLKNNKN